MSLSPRLMPCPRFAQQLAYTPPLLLTSSTQAATTGRSSSFTGRRQNTREFQQPGKAPPITMAVFSGVKESKQPFSSVFELALELSKLQQAGDVSLQPLER